MIKKKKDFFDDVFLLVWVLGFANNCSVCGEILTFIKNI